MTSEAKGTQDNAPIEDGVQADVTGPNQEAWGKDEDRPTPGGPLGGALGAPPGEILNEGTEDEIVGPDPYVWAKDENGNYINRDA